MNLSKIIVDNKVPKVILRYIMINFLDLESIERAIYIVKELNVLDTYSKNFLKNAYGGFVWNCREGHLNIAQWLYARYDITNNNYCDAFEAACKNGHLDVAQWLYPIAFDVDGFVCHCRNEQNIIRPKYGLINWTDIHDREEYLFREVCQRGHLNIAQWLYSLKCINIHVWNDEPFRLACVNNHMDLAKWLVSISLPGCGIYTANNTFGQVCMQGHFGMAQWLVSISQPGRDMETSNKIDIHAHDECAFRWACEYGHLDIAQWLYTLDKIDIHARNSYAMRWAQKMNHINVVGWLQQLV